MALRLLAQGLVHVAGVHLTPRGDPNRNQQAAEGELRHGFSLLRIARWQEGLAASPSLAIRSVQGALRSKLRWVGREEGSAVHELLNELLDPERRPEHIAYSHRGVADSVRSGWADVGVCLRLASEEAGLDFFALREEDCDLCFPAQYAGDPRIRALVAAVRSESYRGLLGGLPGYDTAETGELQSVS